MANYNIEDWLSGCVTANFENYKNIRVFRYYFEDGKFCMQYKYNLQDKSTYLQDEWGPWEEKIVDYNDPDSGVLHRNKTVLRSKKGTADVVVVHVAPRPSRRRPRGTLVAAGFRQHTSS